MYLIYKQEYRGSPPYVHFGTVLHEICVSGTVLWSPTKTKSPTYTYISQNCGSGNRISDFRVSGGSPVFL